MSLDHRKQPFFFSTFLQQVLAFYILFIFLFIYLFIYLIFCFLGPYPQHMEVARLGLQSELPAYTTVIAMPDPSCVTDLHCSSWQRQILNPLIEARDGT